MIKVVPKTYYSVEDRPMQRDTSDLMLHWTIMVMIVVIDGERDVGHGV
jgi:hypothetical protein